MEFGNVHKTKQSIQYFFSVSVIVFELSDDHNSNRACVTVGLLELKTFIKNIGFGVSLPFCQSCLITNNTVRWCIASRWCCLNCVAFIKNTYVTVVFLRNGSLALIVKRS